MNAESALKDLDIPTLMITSANDPTIDQSNYPIDTVISKDNLIYVKTPRGAHVEFMTGARRKRWCNQAMVDYFDIIESLEEEE